jgi:uncharacterized membrane protein
MSVKSRLFARESSRFDPFSLTIIFTIFSLLGFVFEGLWSVVSFGHWDSHYALVWGPFTIIYGFAVVGLMLLYPFFGKRRLWDQFLICFLLGSVFEFGASWLQEFAFGTRSWNYYHLPFNLDGRICLRMSLVWGVVGVVFLRLFAGKLIKLMGFLKSRTTQNLGFAIFVFMICNFTVSIFATIRYSERYYGLAPDSSLEVLIDRRFPDERMQKIYYNMEFVK